MKAKIALKNRNYTEITTTTTTTTTTNNNNNINNIDNSIIIVFYIYKLLTSLVNQGLKPNCPRE